MISRRSFLTALSCLPWVGKLIPASAPISVRPTLRFPDPWVPMTITPSEGGGEIFITSGNSFYTFTAEEVHREYESRYGAWAGGFPHPLLTADVESLRAKLRSGMKRIVIQERSGLEPRPGDDWQWVPPVECGPGGCCCTGACRGFWRREVEEPIQLDPKRLPK